MSQIKCATCGERIFQNSEGAWSILAWTSPQPIFECRPEGYVPLFHAPASSKKEVTT